jgi:aminopeptidase N
VKKLSFYFSFVCLFLVSCSEYEKLKNTHGVSLDLAQYRVKQLSDVNYQLSFLIPPKKEDPIFSKLSLRVSVHDLTNPLYLDFKEDSSHLKYLNVNEQAINIIHEKEHLIISQEFLKLGVNVIDIEFEAGDLSLNRNDDYLYTLLVPDRARTLFPCFDQPNLKATYTLSVKVPKDWNVLASSHLELLVNDGVNTDYRFNESDLMSTYLFSFVAGKFNSKIDRSSPYNMDFRYRETDVNKTSVSIPEIFRLHNASLNYLQNYTKKSFPFQKIDFATIPGFQYGGMEHTGAIQYREALMFLDENATQAQELSRAKLIAHESAHMWFGNLVTMNWFNDVWMKEVFANFMAGKIVNPLFKDVNHELQFLTSHYPSAYGVDRTQGSNPIRQELNNLEQAGSLYGSIIYNKAPIMMRQLEKILGDNDFKTGVQTYIDRFSNSNADWNDLIDIFDQKTSLDIKKWSEVWVNSAGRPLFTDQLVYDENNKIKRFELYQKAEDGSDKIWPQSFEIRLVYPNNTKTFSVSSNESITAVLEAVGLDKPNHILYNSNGFGYGVFPTNKEVIKSAAYIENEVSRAHVYLNAYENMLLGLIDVKSVFDLLMNGVETEKNELILHLITNQTRDLFWNYLYPKNYQQRLIKIEQTLFARLQAQASINIKKTIFNTYRSVAKSTDGINQLYRLWSKDDNIEGLFLNQDEFTTLAQTLSLFGHPTSKEILEEAKAALTNPDKRERFEFMEAALSDDPEIRTAYFESFKSPRNREKESWVQTAAGFMHHPIRQDEGIKTLALSLELLEEIQSTGDIFFPKRWLDVTVGQYTSKQAYDLVLGYFNANPNLSPDLKNKLLQASDKLYRENGGKLE